ncbi:MAG: hypothetical protein KDC92_13295 [Bacteroidetes bacterium]|nr:hypothetical protein [Bacteroidota bacterium]
MGSTQNTQKNLNADLNIWVEDINNWYNELNTLQDDVNLIIGKMVKHQLDINKHQSKLKKLVKQRDFDSGMVVFDDDHLKSEVQSILNGETKNYSQIKNAHEAIKKYHYEFVAITKAFKNALS